MVPMDATPNAGDHASLLQAGLDEAPPERHAEVRDANEDLERSLARVVHDVNNLLTVIVSHLAQLARIVDPDVAARHVEPAIGAARRSSDIMCRLFAAADHAPVACAEAGMR